MVVVFIVTLALLIGGYALLQSIKASANRVDGVNRIKARDNGGRYTRPYRRSEDS